MKLLKSDNKIWLIKHARYAWLHNLKRKYKKHIGTAINRIELEAPVIMNLDNSETLEFLNKVRVCSDDKNSSFYIDFTKIRSITPSCALVFASELDRFSLVRGGKSRLRVVDFNKWKEDIKFLLRDMGLFNLLRIQNLPDSFMTAEYPSHIHFFKFVSDCCINGIKSTTFRDVVAKHTSGIPNSKKLQEALGEAMDNALFHGYPESFIKESAMQQKRWWLSASFDNATNTLNLMFFDQGIGIPKSLPNVHPGLFGTIVSLLDDDDKKIEAATKAGRSSTKSKYRGRGLPQIINYVKSYEKSGFIKITSGKGIYMLQKNEDSKATISLKVNRYDIQGTLIEWQITL